MINVQAVKRNLSEHFYLVFYIVLQGCLICSNAELSVLKGDLMWLKWKSF